MCLLELKPGISYSMYELSFKFWVLESVPRLIPEVLETLDLNGVPSLASLQGQVSEGSTGYSQLSHPVILNQASQ